MDRVSMYRRYADTSSTALVPAARGYGAEVVLHGSIWDEGNERARQLVAERGYTYSIRSTTSS
jgi:threonine dehydratase